MNCVYSAPLLTGCENDGNEGLANLVPFSSPCSTARLLSEATTVAVSAAGNCGGSIGDDVNAVIVAEAVRC